jgi:tripartite-type tricarboxylate transporter receptor subunit TctC
MSQPVLSRRALALGLLAASLGASALAQSSWPNRPLRIVVPFAPGGNTDGIARAIADRLGQSLGQPVIIDNKPGANGAIAADFVARAPSDGYTLLMAAMPVIAILPAISKTNFDPVRDFTPVGNVGSNPFVLAINKSVPAQNLREFADYVRKNPGKLNYASGGSGSVSHLSAVLFLKRAGLDMVHVSYKGGAPAVADLVGGQVQMYFGNYSELAPQAAGGQIRIVGISSDKRIRQAPDLPTIAESGYPGFRTLTWNGLMAPASTPQVIVQRIAQSLKEAVATPEVQQRLVTLGVEPIGDSPAQFAETVKADVATWAEAARASNLKVE